VANFLSPADTAKAFVGVGEKKASLSIGKMIGLGMLAGVFIGLAAHLATTVGTGWTVMGDPALFGLKKFLMGAVFATGLMMVIIPGSELFTGNNLMTIALCERKITFGRMLRNWIVVFIANLVGSILLAYIIAGGSGLLSGNVGGTAIAIASAKVSAVPGGIDHNVAYFFRAIGCNFLVCIAVMMAIAAQDIGGQVWAIFFPIMAFVSSGFEHVVANMYFIPAGIIAKQFPAAVEASGKSAEVLADLNWGTMWTGNLISVTLGNIVGGAVLVGIVYWALFVKQKAAK